MRAKPEAKPVMAPAPASTAAAIANAAAPARAWTPDAPYRERLRAAEGARAYRLYLDERAHFATSAAFYIDVADILLAKGERALALRVLSNLAEIAL